jgi:hypothetical protein
LNPAPGVFIDCGTSGGSPAALVSER